MLRARLFLPALAAAALLTSTAACATGGYYGSRRPSVRQADDRAYRNGYEEGRIQGENDARRGRRFDVGGHSEYRNAQIGYGGYGNRNEYREVFRQGFEAGYNEGYGRYARNGYPSGPYVYGGSGSRAPVYGGRSPVYSTPAYRSVAGEVGFRDGLEQGQKDARDRKAFDPVRAERYRGGDHEYNSRYGSRDDYKREYRAAFQDGYRQGYGR